MSSLNPRRRPQRGLALLVGAWVALGAQAATVQVPVDLLRLGDGAADAAPGALDRALVIDTSTAQRNLDLLLEARRAGDTASPGRNGAPAPLPSTQPSGTLVPLGLQAQDSVTAPGATERREWHADMPVGMQAGLPGGRTLADGGWQGAANPRLDGQPEDAAVPSRVRQLLSDTLQFLRDNRFWLLGSAALLALVAAGVQAVARRR